MTGLQKQLWIRLLESDMSRLYYRKLAARYSRADFFLKYFAAVMSSGTVAGWAIFKDVSAYPNGPLAWKVASGIAALASIAMPLLNCAKKVEWATTLHHSYMSIMSLYEIHWAKLDGYADREIEDVLQKMKEKEDALQTLESHFPAQNDSLVRKCQNEVKHKRGL